MSKVQVDTIDTRSGTSTMQIGSTNTSTINIGVSGDTVNIPSGVTIANAGTATGFGSNTPSFYAYKTATTSLANNTTTTLIPTSVVKNDNTNYDTSNGRFTVPSGEDGFYFMFGSFRINGYAGQRCQAMFYVNGSETNWTIGESVPDGSVSSGNIFATMSATAMMNLSANDYVELRGNQGSGSTNTIFNTVFGGFRIN